MNQIEQQTTCRRRLLSTDSSQQLELFIKQIMQWRAEYDPNNVIFPEAWRIANEKYEAEAHLNKHDDEKEEQPSPLQFSQSTKRQSCDAAIYKIQTLMKDPVDDDYKFDKSDQESETKSDDDEVDFLSDLSVQLEQYTKNTLKETQTQKKIAKKIAKLNELKVSTKLSKDAPIFHPKYEESLEINKTKEQKKLCTISEDEEISAVPSISPVLSPITPSPSPSKNSSIHHSNKSNSNGQKVASQPLPQTSTTVSTISFTPNVSQQKQTANIPASSYSVQTMPSQQAPIQNNQITQQVVQFESTTEQTQVSQHRNDTESIYNTVTEEKSFDNTVNNKHYGYKSYKHRNTNKPSNRFQSFNDLSPKKKPYISQQMILRMNNESMEKFESDHVNDEKLAYDYYKHSVAMQINDRQINVINTRKGLIILINIDLHFKDGKRMYLLAKENDPQFRHKVRWCICAFMRGDELYNEYGVTHDQLPKSSRNMNYFRRAINATPSNIPLNIIEYTNFTKIPEKLSKKRAKSSLSRMKISERDLKYFCRKSWNNDFLIPVVVIKGKKQWVEWKKLIQIYNDQWIGISLRYYPSNRRWKIECMDYDIGRIFYQHRLVGLHKNHKYNYSYNELSGCITTPLRIY